MNHIRQIFEAIDSEECLAFLGAGASTSFVDHTKTTIDGLPSGRDLAGLLADACEYPNPDSNDLLRVAEYFEVVRGDRNELLSLISKSIQIPCEPRPIHTALAQLDKLKFIITTNYDNLMETALSKYGRVTTKNVYDSSNPQTGHFRGPVVTFVDNFALIHKMHGSIEDPNTIIITRTDYIRYIANLSDTDRGMPAYFRTTLLPTCKLLFLGYSLEDWTFNVIWEGVLSQHRNRKGYAIVKDPTEYEKYYWREKDIILINYDLTEFAQALAEKYHLEIPQLGILPTNGNL